MGNISFVSRYLPSIWAIHYAPQITNYANAFSYSLHIPSDYNTSSLCPLPSLASYLNSFSNATQVELGT